MLALKNVYGFGDCDAYGPILKSVCKKDNGYELSFYNADGGFKIKEKAQGFEISYDGETFEEISPEVNGNKIILNCKPDAKEIRYQWFNYNEVTVFGKNSIPLAPFREILK